MTENENLEKQIADDLSAVLKEAKSMGCKEVTYFRNIPLQNVETVVKTLEEIQQYRAIGTIDEFKALKEKNEPKKPRFYAHNYHCVECGNLVGNNEFEWQRFLYCDKCGQKLDWSE